MATKIFLNTPPEPDVVVNYSDDLQHCQVSVQDDKNNISAIVFSSVSDATLSEKLSSFTGLDIENDQYEKINLRFRRSLFGRKWVVTYGDVKLSGLKIG